MDPSASAMKISEDLDSTVLVPLYPVLEGMCPWEESMVRQLARKRFARSFATFSDHFEAGHPNLAGPTFTFLLFFVLFILFSDQCAGHTDFVTNMCG